MQPVTFQNTHSTDLECEKETAAGWKTIPRWRYMQVLESPKHERLRNGIILYRKGKALFLGD
jgi:hypothetical protein